MRRIAWCCWFAVGCGVLGDGPSERPEECADGIDNDRDLRWDGDDPDCIGISEPPVAPDPTDEETDTTGTCSTSGLQIADVSVACTANDAFVNITVDVAGFVSSADLYMTDTVSDPAWGENHPLDPDSEDACGVTLKAHLETDVGLEFVAGASTLWWCSEFFEAEAMTYVVRVTDAYGEACVAWGHDPQGLVDGEYYGVLVNEPEFYVDTCEVLP